MSRVNCTCNGYTVSMRSIQFCGYFLFRRDLIRRAIFFHCLALSEMFFLRGKLISYSLERVFAPLKGARRGHFFVGAIEKRNFIAKASRGDRVV